MIQKFLERKSKVTLITRPRHFGKTLNMSIMASFLSHYNKRTEMIGAFGDMARVSGVKFKSKNLVTII